MHPPSNPRLDGGWSRLTLQSNIPSPTVQPWVGRWMHTAYPSLEAEWGLRMRYLLSTCKYSWSGIISIPHTRSDLINKRRERWYHAVVKDTFPMQFNAPPFPALARTILSKQTESVSQYCKTQYRTGCHLQDNCTACVDTPAAFWWEFSYILWHLRLNAKKNVEKFFSIE